MGSEEKKQQAHIHKEKINPLDNELKNLNIERIYLQKLRKERDRLKKIKQTVDIFVNMPELKKSLRPFINTEGRDIPLRKIMQGEDKEKDKLGEIQNSKNDISILLTWIMIAISAVIIVCAFLPWLEISGRKINFWEINSAISNFFDFLGGDISLEIQNAQAILWIINICIWVIAIFYGTAIYKLCKGEKADILCSGTIYTVILVLILLLGSLGINEKIKEALFDFPFVKLQISIFAWITLILSSVASVTYYLKNSLERSNIGYDTEQKEHDKKIYKFAVTNYCLWTTLNLLSANFVKKGENVYISFDYIANSYISNSEKAEKAKMNLTFGIQIETEGGIYTIDRGIYQIKHIGKFGETSKVCLAYCPFEVEKIRKVFIYGMEENFAGKRKLYRNVYIDSGLNSKELMEYRKDIKYDGALCKQKEIGQGWICSCGLYHEKEEESCQYCGMTIKKR